MFSVVPLVFTSRRSLWRHLLILGALARLPPAATQQAPAHVATAASVAPVADTRMLTFMAGPGGVIGRPAKRVASAVREGAWGRSSGLGFQGARKAVGHRVARRASSEPCAARGPPDATQEGLVKSVYCGPRLKIRTSIRPAFRTRTPAAETGDARTPPRGYNRKQEGIPFAMLVSLVHLPGAKP
jgi:hypothetical protein